MKSLLLPLSLSLLLPLSPLLRAEPWTAPLDQLRKVGPEGAGNAEAAAAWTALTALGPEMLVPVLTAMEGASPLARNWMRTAVETVFDRALAAKTDVPGGPIKAFLVDRKHEPNARRLAFELYSKISPEEAAALVPGFADDPSPALRRDAVAKLLAEGKAQLESGDQAKSLATLNAALDAAREVDQIDAVTKLLREKLGQKVDLPRHFGFLSHWHLIAPFDNTGRAGFDRVFSPETEVKLDAEYPGKEDKPVKWQAYATPDDYGKVDFNQPFGPIKEVTGYAYTEFNAAEARDAQIRLGCKNAWKVWFNGELLFGRDEYHRGQRIDQYSLPVKLKQGKNTILVKACQNEQTQDWTAQWEFQLRVCDATGTAILATDRQPTPEKAAPVRRRPNREGGAKE
jgi:hypothetical protein